MPRKTKIIFIVVFIIVGAIMISWYSYSKRNTGNTAGSTNSGYGLFSSLGGSTSTDSSPVNSTKGDSNNISGGGDKTIEVEGKNRLYQITDFAISGATFFEDMRPLTKEEMPQKGGKEGPVTETTKSENTDKPMKGGKTPGAINSKVVETKKTTEKPIQQKYETIPSLSYVEKATGHIYQMYLDTKEVIKVSNSTIPTIYEALFDSRAKSIIYRYLSEDSKTISTFFATLGGDKGEFLPSNIIDVSLSPDKNSFFYLAKNTNGVTGTTKSFTDTKKTQVFSSPYTEWLSQWVSPQKIYMTTKASGLAQGNLFSLNTVNGTMTKLFGGVLGLTTLANKDGSLVLYNASNGGGPQLGIFNVVNHTTVSLDLYSLPEKCIWANDNVSIYCGIPNNIEGVQPDSWYKGLNSFDDKFVKINSETGEVTDIINSADFTAVDAIHLFLNKDNTVLYFTNKKDSTLWGLDL